jgi:hypothetical protein
VVAPVVPYGCRRDLIYVHEADRRGHVAAWEQPQLFSEESRAAFDRYANRLPTALMTHGFNDRIFEGRPIMKWITLLLVAVATLASFVAVTVPASERNKQEAPISVTEIPPEYRDWRLISVAREEGDLNDIRAILGNDVAINAYREGKLPFPDGTIIARLAWSYDASEENNKVFGQPQSFVAGLPKNGVQFMVKDSKQYASTGGWGFAQFDDGKPAAAAVLNTCFACHQAIKERDRVFTRYAP